MESLLEMSEAAIKANAMYHLAVRDKIMDAHIEAATEAKKWVDILERKQQLRNESEQQTEFEQREDALKAMMELSQVFTDAMTEVEQEHEAFWNSLSQEQQLAVFCAVARRIYKGDIEEKGTYRYVLYDVFGFGPEAYAPAQLAGYLAIHNAIMTPNEQRELLVRFAKHHNLGEEAVSDFYTNYY